MSWIRYIIRIQRVMEQLEILDNAPRRDLDNEDDIERLVDQNQEEEDRELKNKIIFNVQGLGGIRTIKAQEKVLQAYIKGTHCEESVQDLVKFIRRDSPFNPRTRLILADFNILESDLLKLLPLQVEDKKLSFWIIALMALMTSKPHEQLNSQESAKLSESLRNYKQSFIDSECLSILIVHMADFYRTPDESKKKAHYQMQQFIILLLRNLAQIPNHEKQPNLHNHFLAALLKQEIMNPILYILQKDFSSFRSKIDIPLLQILYFTFTSFDPALVYTAGKKSIYHEALSYKSKQAPIPARHSRFLPHFEMTSSTGVKRLTFKLNNQEEKPIQGQRKLPQRMVDYKKVVSLELEKFGSDFMTLQVEIEGKPKPLAEIVASLIQQFLELQFELIVKQVFNDIFRESPKVNDQHITEYLLLCSWALQMVRARYHFQRNQTTNEQDKSQIKLELSWIVEVMQNAHFELIYKILFREATREKKKLFKINIFNAALKLFNSYLDVISDISTSMNLSDRKNANVLMSNVFRHDIARILRIGFNLISHEGILTTLIKVTHKFFKLLSVYSDGKVLTIQTNRLLKRKKKHYSDDEQELEILREGGQQNEEQENNRMREDEGRFQERKYNQKSEFAILAEYGIISKYVTFLRNQRFANNPQELNEAIFFFFTQIKKLLNGEWLFYQADTICTFQAILSNHDWIRKHREIGKFIQAVCLSFIKLLRKNPLALVESLFRYSNLTLKEHILKNYSQEYEEGGEQEQNMFTDQ